MKTSPAIPLLLSPPLFLCLAFLCFFGSTATAQAESPQETASRLQQRYDHIQSLSFDFIQDTRGQLSGRPKKGSGQAFFVKTRENDKKSAKMRWNYLLPEQQVLVSDGKTFSMYFASLHQMIVSPASALEQDLTYSFFTGAGNLMEDFTISQPDPGHGSQGETVIIKLVPRSRQSQVAAIHLWITPDSLIRRIEILDHFDTLTVLNFSRLMVDTLDPLDTDRMKRLFQFSPPEGTEIINQ